MPRSGKSVAAGGPRLVLVPLQGHDADRHVLEAAGDIVRPFGAHVTAVHVPAEPPAIAELAGTRVAPRDFGRSSAAASDRRAGAARRAFEAWRDRTGWHPATEPGAAGGVTLSYEESFGDEPAVLGARALLSDLVVIARPEGAAALVVLDTLLTATGRPVLMVPPAPARFGGAVVAWNGTAPSARALAAALPLLRAFEGTVTVLTVAERNRPAEAPAAVTYLRWHDIPAVAAVPSQEDVGRQLLSLAHESGAGLIVSGAYSHGKLRHALFGGVTTALIERSDVPVLFMA